MSDLAEGDVRVFANAGVGRLVAGRWADVPAELPNLEGLIAAGLVSRTGPRGEAPPERLPSACCGAR